MNPTNFKIILWDFDGVIIESNSVREYGFKKVLESYPKDQIDKLLIYHNKNGGLSRYVKFRYFFEVIRNESTTEMQVNELASQFSRIMKERLTSKSLLIQDTIQFLDKMFSKKKLMYVVSGSDQKELRDLCEKLNIAKYFKEIYGSPTLKTKLVKKLVDQKNITDFCLIGDSINDKEAAEDNNIKFFAYNNLQLKTVTNSYIESFSF